MAIAEIKWKLVKDTYFFDTTTCYLWGVIKESKESARKSIKESKDTDFFNAMAKKFNFTKDELKKYKDKTYISVIGILFDRIRFVPTHSDEWYNAMNDCWEGIQTAEDNGFNVDYEKKTYDKIMMTPNYNRESKKSVRKSIEESRQSILDKRFYELVDEGYIYDEDEDGMNMSYGELVAVSDDLWETLEDELKYYDDFQEAYDVYMDIMDNTSDDTKMFMTGLDEYFYFDINEDEGTYSVDGEIPFILEKLFKKFQKETDFERV